MKVREAMTADVRVVNPAQTIREAARLMVDCDIGALPVAGISTPGGAHSQAAH